MTNEYGPYLTYKGVLVGQTKTTPDFLKFLIKENSFSVIIEIGTHRGGLSLWINDNKPDNCNFYTLDIEPNYLQIDPEKKNIKFLKGDCFTDLLENLINLIRTDKQILLLCDGGNKEQEFKTFAPYLKPNDIIMCHDFVEDFDTYQNIQNQIGWPSGPESFMDNLKPIIEQYCLQPYFLEESKKCFWGCFKKA